MIVAIGTVGGMKTPPTTPPVEDLTLQEVADKIGCSRATVSRITGRLGVGRMKGNMKLIPATAVEQIRGELKGGPGNPDFGVKYVGPQPSTRPDAKKPGRPRKS